MEEEKKIVTSFLICHRLPQINQQQLDREIMKETDGKQDEKQDEK